MDDQQFVEYGNTQAPQIDGWFFPPDMLAFFRLAGIQRSFGITGSLCELGVWHGKSLVLMSRFVPFFCGGNKMYLKADGLAEVPWLNPTGA